MAFEPAALRIYIAKVFPRATFLLSESRAIPCELRVKAAPDGRRKRPREPWILLILHGHLFSPVWGDPQLHLQLLQQTRLLPPPWPYWGKLAPVPNQFLLSPTAAMDDLPVGLMARISGKCQIAMLSPRATTNEPSVREPSVRSLGLDWRWFGVFWPTE